MTSRTTIAVFLLTAGVAAPPVTVHAQPPQPAEQVPPAVGACVGCHGSQGEGNPAVGTPRIAGQSAYYLSQQLDSYANGSRRDPVMEPIARGLPPEIRAEVAAYYAQLDAPFDQRGRPERPPERGRTLAMEGDDRLGVAACRNCHGPGGVGEPPDIPYLGGLDARYLGAELTDWKVGTRTNDAGQQMFTVVVPLSAEDIDAVAQYYASLSPPKPAPPNLVQAPPPQQKAPAAAFGDWQTDAPGVRRHIRPSDVPAPVTGIDAEAGAGSVAKVVEPPQGALPKVPDGFAVQVFATGFEQPRTLRIAPNGDVFLAESGAGRVLVFRGGGAGGAPVNPEVFAENLDRPYGIVFQPPVDPRYVYVAAANQVARYPYRSGAVEAAGPAEVIVGNIPTERHWTRDLAVSRDGKRLFLAVGSASNVAGGMPDMTSENLRRHEATHGRGAAWGGEENRAVVRVFDPEGKTVRNYATGLRNCSGLAMQPGTDNLWCVVNERDHLGPHVTPDYMAHVQEGGFYGWPWYYLGDKEDPRWKGKRPDLESEVRVPEVLIQAHSSALSLAFYDRDAFPAEYRGDAFVALHGSHTRPERTGYKVIRVRMKDGKPTGEYEDFMTGFVVDNDSVWGRPAGVAVTRDGALLVSDDANGTIFRVTRSSR